MGQRGAAGRSAPSPDRLCRPTPRAVRPDKALSAQQWRDLLSPAPTCRHGPARADWRILIHPTCWALTARMRRPPRWANSSPVPATSGNLARACARSTRAPRRKDCCGPARRSRARKPTRAASRIRISRTTTIACLILTRARRKRGGGQRDGDRQRGAGPGADRSEPWQRANQHLWQRRAGSRQHRTELRQ